jgi:hypothetical protein
MIQTPRTQILFPKEKLAKEIPLILALLHGNEIKQATAELEAAEVSEMERA